MDYSQLDHTARLVVAAPLEPCRQLLSADVTGDAVAIAESVAHGDRFTSTLSYRVDVSIQDHKYGPDVLTRDVPEAITDDLSKLSPQGIIRVGSRVACGELLVGRLGFRGTDDSVRYAFLDPGLVTAVTIRAPNRYTCGTCGDVADREAQTKCPFCNGHLSDHSRDSVPAGSAIHITIDLLVRRPLRAGDVLVDEKGNSLVVACILVDGLMPTVDSLPVQCLVDERSRSADQLDRIGTGSHPRMRLVAKRDRRFRHGHMTLKKHSLRLEQKVSACGCSRHGYSLVTQMPLRKPDLFGGGQHLPRDRTRALLRQGFRENVAELLTLKSDAYGVRDQIPHYVRGDMPIPGLGSEACQRLLLLLKSLCIAPLFATASGEERRWGQAAGDEAVLLTLGIAPPRDIRSWSFGEVKKPEMINYRTYRCEKDGLMCEKIFGPEKDWECSCGKHRGIEYKGWICDRCGVKVTSAHVRRKRLGHIELATAVLHPWFFDDIADLLGMDHDAIRGVVRHEKYVVTKSTTSLFAPATVLTDDELHRALEKVRKDALVAETGAEAVRTLLLSLDLDARRGALRQEIDASSAPARVAVLKRQLAVAEAFQAVRGNVAQVILDVIPVLPPDLRPLIMLRTDEFRSSDVNELYGRVIRLNNQLRKSLDLDAPEVVIRSSRRLLQLAVESLFDNEWQAEPLRNAHERPLRSLSGELTLAAGHVYDKDVEYAASAVVVPDSSQAPGRTIGLPSCVAAELFGTCLADEEDLSTTPTEPALPARRPCATGRLDEAAASALQEAMNSRPLLVVTTRHRAKGMHGRIVDGEAVRMHPDDAAALGLEFDGQFVSVYVPLGKAAMQEAVSPSKPVSDNSVLATFEREFIRMAVLQGRGAELHELDRINCGF